ncbi:hypothetical protein ACP70R_048911 [Stipagrostis hirtigluma subsp. patula]
MHGLPAGRRVRAFVEILRRLPVRSVGRCRAVCRDWNAATSHPSFDRVLAKRPAAVAKVSPSHFYFHLAQTWVVAAVFELFRGRWHPDNVHKVAASTVGLSLCCARRMIFPSEALRSWDGFLCIQASTWGDEDEPEVSGCQAAPPNGGECVLWNPLTGAYAVVAAPAGHGRIIGGYTHPVTGRFHLLHCSYDNEAAESGGGGLAVATMVRILAVGDTHWRQVPLLPRQGGGSKILMKSQGDRSVNLHGNLHWLVQPSGSERAALLVFDAAREEFLYMAAPESRALDVAMARLRLLSGDKLCILVLATRPPALEMWVLDDYSGPRSWRLRDKIRMVLMDGTDLSPTFAAAAAEVEVVEGVEEGEEILLRLDGWVHAYSFRHKWWRKVSVTQSATLLAHRESVMPREISFGEASQVIPRTPPRSRRRG